MLAVFLREFPAEVKTRIRAEKERWARRAQILTGGTVVC